MEGQPGPDAAAPAEREGPAPETKVTPEPTPAVTQPPRSAKLSWPPPRMPPRSSASPSVDLPSPSERAHEPAPLAEPAFDSHFSVTGMSRTPSGEIRISQIRDLLFGDVQVQYEQRLQNLEAQLTAVQAEMRTRLGVMESSIVGEIGGALSTLTERVVSGEAATNEALSTLTDRLVASESTLKETKTRVDAQLAAQHGVGADRFDTVESELRALRGELDALTEGLRIEVRAIASRAAEDLKKEVTALVQQKVSEEIARIFLAVGGSLKKREGTAASGGTADLPTLGVKPNVTSTGPLPVMKTPPALSAPPPPPVRSVTTEAPALAKAPISTEPTHRLERWAEELTSGDIRILDPEVDESGHPKPGP
ncbi:hypothetical protein L6R52_29600 [Myxococcota bacterium]|nr:hypothetical protein [Myxococcota bacterium]